MSLTLRAYGPGNSPKLFPYGGRMGSYAEANSFEGFLPEVLKTATSYNLSAIITRNGYNLGTHAVRVRVEGVAHDVMVSACGERVSIDAPTIEVLRAAWNQHMAGVGRCLGNQASFRIAVYCLDAQGRPTADAPVFGSFMLAEKYAEDMEAVMFELYAETLPNDFELGTDVGNMDGVPFEVTSTGCGVVVTSASLDVAREAAARFWDDLQTFLSKQQQVAV